MIFLIYVESPVDKSSIRGLRDTNMSKPAKDWFGMSPQFVRTIADIDISRLHADRDACKGITDTSRGATLRTTETLKLKNRDPTKRSQTVRGEGVTASKSSIPVALARRVCQNVETA